MRNLHLQGVMIGILAAGLLAGCSSTMAPPKHGEELVWSSADGRPAWTVNPPRIWPEDEDVEYVHVVGQSDPYRSERSARESAMQAAFTEAARQIGMSARQEVERRRTSAGSPDSDGTLDTEVEVETVTRQLAHHYISRLEAEQWYVERWKERDGDSVWHAWVKARMPVSELERAYHEGVENFGGEIGDVAMPGAEEAPEPADVSERAEAEAQ